MHRGAKAVVLVLSALTALAAGTARSDSEESWCKRDFWYAASPLPLTQVGNTEGVILPEEAAPNILCQCSRRTPGRGVGYWVPTASEIADLERKLPSYVKAHARGEAIPLGKLKRQYLGIIRPSHRAIYVNAFFPMRQFTERWRRSAIMVCDGGARFFGAEYDVEHRVFTHIAFNGEA